MPKLFRAFRDVFLISITTLAALEIALALIDPFGMAFFAKVDWLDQYLGRANGSYSLSPGTYDMNGWRVSMNETPTRIVPESGTGCTVLFTGDSVTWGWGVNDGETFANLIATELGVNAINAAVFGYSSEDVAASLQYFNDYDLAVYLIFPNDHHYTWDITAALQPPASHTFPGFGLLHGGTPAAVWYSLYLMTQSTQGQSTEYWDRFYAAMDAISAHDNVLIFGFDEPVARQASERYDVHLIDWYSTSISRVDSHPDLAGHQQIADAMLPAIRERLGEVCAVQ
ncbi:MAG TPA: SGNH/GDSL hydrolase family protein [Spirillospora sp.]|nr:SGNH/GDSL hydrolase family protein [Spirillospora sp.]